MRGDRLRRWVDAVEWRGFVEVAIAKWRHDSMEHRLDEMKIAEKFFMVELRARDGHHNLPVVAVQTLAYSSDENRVCGCKLALNLDSKLPQGRRAEVRHRCSGRLALVVWQRVSLVAVVVQ